MQQYIIEIAKTEDAGPRDIEYPSNRWVEILSENSSDLLISKFVDLLNALDEDLKVNGCNGDTFLMSHYIRYIRPAVPDRIEVYRRKL